MKQLMVQEASMEIRVRPFSDKGNGWRWPKETQPERGAFAFAFEGSTLVLTVPKPVEHSPDLRALTILEGHERGVLHHPGPVTAIRLELGYAWHPEDVHHLARRAAFLTARLGTPISVMWTQKRGGTPAPVEHRDPLADVPSIRRGEILIVPAGPKRGFEALADALDLWLKGAVAALEDAAVNGDDPVFPAVILKSPVNRIHPRIHWIASRLRNAGIPIETPDPEDAPPTGFVAKILEACLAHRHKILPIRKGDSEAVTEYEHILPEKKRALALWKPLQGRLETGDLMRVRDIHDQFANLKSSQAFAVNLFKGLEHAGVLADAIAGAFGTRALADPHVHLEFYDPGFKAFLGESDHQTQVDVVVTALEGTVLKVFLIEVKLTEPHFGRCRGPYLEDNKSTLLCGNAPAAERCDRCHLKAAKKRTYLDLADVAFPKVAAVLGAEDACPLRLDGYQLARNLCFRAWLAGEILYPAAPGFPKRLARPGVTSVDARFAVVASEKTPALSSEPLRRLGNSAAERLGKLGVDWVDARALLDVVRSDPRARELVEYLDERYAPVFAPDARS